MMWAAVGYAGAAGLIIGALIFFAAKNASKTAQLEALKAEIKREAEEQKYAQRITAGVNRLPGSIVRERLQNVSQQ